MAFYLKPCNGNISLSALEDICLRRCLFLAEITRFDGNFVKMKDYIIGSEISDTDSSHHHLVEGSECLIEGTKKDNVAHFMLRLICAEGKEKFAFVTAENFLFHYRFSCMNEKELIHFFQSLRRDMRRLDTKKVYACSKFGDVISILNGLIQAHGVEPLVRKYLNGNEKPCIKVPFTYVSNLVADRSVIVKNGWAYIPFCKLQALMAALFFQSLTVGMESAKQSLNLLKTDIRFRKLLKIIQNIFSKCNDSLHGDRDFSVQGDLYMDQIDEIQQFIPLCMRNIHRNLRKNHKVPHHSRIQYTLMLKEIGLPVQEAISFWRGEYLKPSKSEIGQLASKWRHNESRYIYNIRHLYGLEGSRINCRSHTCSHLQYCTLQSGGCPFKHFDAFHLEEELKMERLNQSDIELIIVLSRNQLYKEACSQFFIAKFYQQFSLHSCEKEGKNSQVKSEDNVSQYLNDTQKWISSQLASSQIDTAEIENTSNNCSKRIQKTDEINKNYCDSMETVCVQCSNHVTDKRVFEILSNDEVRSFSDDLTKPVDYYVTFKQLVEKLKDSTKIQTKI
ncbi:DNA primase large subunit-like [Tubulanus polymorphus]|uniref:DNA primase large subunit-like n=1 Tax=Tubulanus polymorphus TaxID=672921 RepID=UPI003DA53B4A